jgi:hypothetical protein
VDTSNLEFDPFSEGQLKQAFRTADQEHRAGILTHAVRVMADGLRGVSVIADLANVDSQRFCQGLKTALEENPKNLTAARALLWFYIRKSSFQEARKVYAEIEKHWNKYDQIFLEHIRMLIVDSSIVEAEDIYQKSKSFFRTVGVVSYKLQTSYLSDPGAAKDRQLDLLRLGGLALCDASPRSPEGQTDLFSPTEISAIAQLIDLVSKSSRVALVGNAPTLLGLGKGSEIDGFDLIVRCNFPDVLGYETDVGSRTDVVVFNESIRHRLPSIREKSPSFADKLSIGLHPEPTFGLPTPVSASYNNVGTMPPSARSFLAEVCYARCTTGLMAINMLIFLMKKKVSLFGFDFFSNESRPHYFGAQTGAYLGHELQYEQWFVTKFLADNYRDLIDF